MLEPSYAWQEATAKNNVIQAMTPRFPAGFPTGARMRMQGKPDKRLKEKTRPLPKRNKGVPTKMPEDFFQAMPAPAGARVAGQRPTQADQRSARAQAAAMAVHDGLDASMPVDQRAMLYGNASRATQPKGKPHTKTLLV